MNKPFSRDRLISSVILLVSLAFPAVAMRSVLLSERGWLSAVDFPGFGGDLLVGAVLATILILLGRRFKYLAIVVAALLALLAVGNYENIRVLGSNLNPTYVGYLSDGTFLAGSGSSLAHPVISVLILCLSVAGAFLWTRARFQTAKSYGTVLMAVLVGCALLAVNTGDGLVTAWRRENVVVASLGDLWARTAANALVSEVDTSSLLTSDLDGAPIVDYPRKRPNVLFVVLESVSGAYLPSFREAAGMEGGDEISMPLLDKIAGEGLSYPLFISHQRQTNRGTFALLCGRLPKLSSTTAKMTEYAERVEPPQCLPELLRDAGYNTAYLQAASTAFMHKDVFMSLAGFETVLGDVWPDVDARARGGWGVDDKTFFDIATQHIGELEEAGEPWFVTLLTSGTHHPYTLPDDFRPGVDRDVASYEYLDEGVDSFIRGLEAQGVLDDTLVIITSDEAAGIKGIDDSFDVFLSRSWSFAVALLPGRDKPQQSISEAYSQVDLALTVADYLNLPTDEYPFMGRSMFRRYEAGRPIFMGNTYAQRQLALFPDSLLVCNESRWDCDAYDLSVNHHIVAAGSAAELDMEKVSLLKAIAQEAEWATAAMDDATPVRLVRPDASIQVASTNDTQVFSGPRFTVPAHHKVNVEFDVEVEGEGLVQLSHFLEVGQDNRLEHVVPIPVLSAGDRVRVSYSLDFAEERRVDLLRLNAKKFGEHGDPLVKVHGASYSVQPATKADWVRSNGAPIMVADSQFDYQPTPDAITLDLSQDGVFHWPDCVAPRDGAVVADGCEPKFIAFGPYFTAAPGSEIEFVYEAEVVKGEAALEADITSGYGSNQMARTDKALFREGETFTGTVSTAVAGTEAVPNIETRLFMEPGSDGASVAIKNLLVRIKPSAESDNG